MPENDQIQSRFQPGNQINSQIQENNFAKNQQQIQETSQQNLSQNSKPHKSWLNKFLGWIFIFL